MNKLASLFPRHHTIILHSLYTFIVHTLMLNISASAVLFARYDGINTFDGNYSLVLFRKQGGRQTMETRLTDESSKVYIRIGHD